MADSGSSSEEDLDDMTPFERVVHADAYKRALKFPQQVARYGGTEERLDGIVDQMKLWVKNTATEYDPKREVQTFVITVFPRTPIKEIRATIFSIMGFKAPVTRFGDDSDDEVPPPDAESALQKRLKLIYRGLVLEDGKVFDDYEWKKERWKWSKPYAGIVWVSPFQPEPMYRSMRRPTAK